MNLSCAHCRAPVARVRSSLSATCWATKGKAPASARPTQREQAALQSPTYLPPVNPQAPVILVSTGLPADDFLVTAPGSLPHCRRRSLPPSRSLQHATPYVRIATQQVRLASSGPHRPSRLRLLPPAPCRQAEPGRPGPLELSCSWPPACPDSISSINPVCGLSRSVAIGHSRADRLRPLQFTPSTCLARHSPLPELDYRPDRRSASLLAHLRSFANSLPRAS